ncbi:MAG TPA: protein-glutamate O-methyltransferase CheR [Treponemataceae bacterium]|nr:protein-glutamate O-methyltransferase CheR [Treponemataceae bacterium]
MADLLTNSEFEKFSKFIYDNSGITFSATNRSILESRLKERLRVTKLQTIDEYYRLVVSDPEENKTMLDSVTTNLTRFFRNLPHFETLEKYVFPLLIKYKKAIGSNNIKIWSAGCSTGEEPYTIAMIAKEKLPPGFDIEIIASDLSLKSLMIGRQGFYPESRVAAVPKYYLNKYFTAVNGGYQTKDEIMKTIKFDYHNLKHDSGLRKLDIIFCRNVLIYFDEMAQKAVINRFWESMASEAYLFIGHSESLFGMNTKFEFVKTDWACLYRKYI